MKPLHHNGRVSIHAGSRTVPPKDFSPALKSLSERMRSWQDLIDIVASLDPDEAGQELEKAFHELAQQMLEIVTATTGFKITVKLDAE